jgi:peptide/nickel transport system permease protein
VLQFIFRKIIYGLLVLAGVVMIVFFLFNILPADPARLTLGQRADVQSVEAVRKELYLDKPIAIQFLMYVNDILPISIHPKTEQEKYKFVSMLDFGEKSLVFKKPYLRQSYQTKRNVTDVLLSALPQTILLAFAAMIIATIIGILFGLLAAVRHRTWVDNSLMFISVLGISQPSYFSGVILAILFGYVWSDFTGLNYTGSIFELNDWGDKVIVIKNLILPAIALGIRPISLIFQLTRSSMLDVLTMDYIRTAKAKGLSNSKVLFKHALRNGLNPVLTAVSGWFAGLLAGAYFIEIIFDFKGLGYVTIKSLESLDFPIVMGAILMMSFVFIIINILVDIMYGVLDPRVKNAK